jgi:hypothetical protein
VTAYQPRLKRAETGKLLIRASVMNTSMTTIRHKSSNDFRVIQSGTIAIALNRAMAAAGVIPWTTIRARKQEREQRQTNVSAKRRHQRVPVAVAPRTRLRRKLSHQFRDAGRRAFRLRVHKPFHRDETDRLSGTVRKNRAAIV